MNSYLPSRLRTAIWYFILAYWIVTVLGILLTVLFAAIFKPPSPQELSVPFSQAPAYLMTLPYHPLLNLVWLPFAWMYLTQVATLGRRLTKVHEIQYSCGIPTKTGEAHGHPNYSSVLFM